MYRTHSRICRRRARVVPDERVSRTHGLTYFPCEQPGGTSSFAGVSVRAALYRQLALFCHTPVKGITISKCPFDRAFYTTHSERPFCASSSLSLPRASSAKRTEPNWLSKRMRTSVPKLPTTSFVETFWWESTEELFSRRHTGWATKNGARGLTL